MKAVVRDAPPSGLSPHLVGSRVLVDLVEREEYVVRRRSPAVGGFSRAELFVASFALSSAYYARWFLTRRGLDPLGLRITAEHLLTDGGECVHLDVQVPGGTPETLLRGLRAVTAHCSSRSVLG